MYRGWERGQSDLLLFSSFGRSYILTNQVSLFGFPVHLVWAKLAPKGLLGEIADAKMLCCQWTRGKMRHKMLLWSWSGMQKNIIPAHWHCIPLPLPWHTMWSGPWGDNLQNRPGFVKTALVLALCTSGREPVSFGSDQISVWWSSSNLHHKWHGIWAQRTCLPPSSPPLPWASLLPPNGSWHMMHFINASLPKPWKPFASDLVY